MLIESLPAACTGLELREWMTPEKSVVAATVPEAVFKNFRLSVSASVRACWFPWKALRGLWRKGLFPSSYVARDGSIT